MSDGFSSSIGVYCNPLYLETFKKILYTNPVNSNFEDVNLLELNFPFLTIQPLFCRSKTSKSNVTKKIPFCHKPDFQSQGIPCEKLDEFVLNDSKTSLKKTDISVCKIDEIENLLPRLFKNQSKLFRKPCFDEKFAFQVNLNEPMKSLKELIPNLAWEWPFELDMFQKRAIVALENSKSVFVAAHTSAGKTVVAEYATAMCHNRGARVIYTSPIKALSNQKYREFKITFGNENVGLLTGDIKTGANRYILVMTTEILHNMLKNNCATLRDLEVVIMDEVHYLNDDSRGHIWEQIMILLPKNIQLVMLSATVPNTMQFAEWLGRIRKTQIQVISTVKRPVPLEIYLFTATGRNKRDQFFRIMDSNKNFHSQGYQAAEKIIKGNAEKLLKKFQSKPMTVNQNQQTKPIDKTNKPSKFQNPDLKLKSSDNYNTVNKDHNQWLALFEALKEKDNLPVICFLFSRNRIQNTVCDLRSIDLLSHEQKSAVRRYFKEIIGRKMPNPHDKKLPQVLEMRELLLRGIAMHHAGLLPVLKEIVEILFSQGYVKILFATETFAVGVNMPARSVVFDSIEKFEGSKKRLLLPGEFTQMAGRAGRRGIDDIGTVIILIKPQSKMYSQDDLKRTLIGSACQLESKFKISYNMILSLYRNRQFNMQHMIRHSFIEADRLKKYDDNCMEFKDISENLKLISYSGLKCIEKKCNLDTVVEYYKVCVEYRELKKAVDELLESKNELQNFMGPGRLILLDSSGLPNTYSKERLLIPAIVLSLNRQTSGNEKYKIKVLTYDLSNPDNNSSEDKELNKDPNIVPIRPTIDKIFYNKLIEMVPKIFEVTLNNINKVCNTKIKIDVQEIEKHWLSRFFRKSKWSDWICSSSSFKNAACTICDDVVDKLDCANYDKELNIKDPRQRHLLMKYFSFENPISSPLLEFPCVDCLSLTEHIRLIVVNEKMITRLDELQQNLSDENLAFLPEYRCKVTLLKELDFLNPIRDTIKLKGRIACEIESYEIVVTEMILSGVFLNADPCDIAASLSCLMHENKSLRNQSFQFKLTDVVPSLQKMLKELISIVEKINICQENLNILNNEIQINCELVESVRMWTLGSKFSDIVEMTEIQCGDIVRCLQRLCELLRHCESAGKVMGNFGLAALFKRTQESIYRGIVSTSSLYVDDIEEVSDDMMSVQVPTNWRQAFLSPSDTLDPVPLFFRLYENLPASLGHLALACLVQAASFRRSFFNNNERQIFLGQLVNGVCDILSRNGGNLEDASCYHELCRLVCRLKSNFQLGELVTLSGYSRFIELLAQFTVRSLEAGDSDSSNSQHYLLLTWQRLVASLPYLRCTQPHLLDTHCPIVLDAYVRSRMRAAVSQDSNGPWGDLEDAVSVPQELEAVAVLSRCQYAVSVSRLVTLFDDIATRFSTEGSNNAVTRLRELCWLVLLMGACISGRIGCAGSSDDNDRLDGELVARVLQLAGMIDTECLDSNAHLIQALAGLEVAVLAFLDQIRRVYLCGESCIRAVRLYEILQQRISITDDNALLETLIQKILVNLRCWAGLSKPVISRSLALLHELSLGAVAKRLMKLPVVISLLENHSPMQLPFLMHSCRDPQQVAFGTGSTASLSTANNSTTATNTNDLYRHNAVQLTTNITGASSNPRTCFYASLTRLFLLSPHAEEPAVFLGFMAPLTHACDSLTQTMLSTSNNVVIADQTTANNKLALLALIRDVRGVATACHSKCSFQALFDWLYPAMLSHLIVAIDLWGPTEPCGLSLGCLKLAGELSLSRNNRLQPQVASPSGELMFRVCSRILICYGEKINHERLASIRSNKTQYLLYIKEATACIDILRNLLTGNYVNLGAFALYADDSLEKCLHIFLQLMVSIPPEDMMAYPKLARSYYCLADSLTQDHLIWLGTQQPEMILYFVNTICDGLTSTSLAVSSSCCSSLDNIASFLLRLAQSQIVSNNAIKPSHPNPTSLHLSDNVRVSIDHFLMTSQHLGRRESESREKYCMLMELSTGQLNTILSRSMENLFQALMQPECKNQWAMSRPLLGLILLNNKAFEDLQQCYASSASPETMKSSFEKLMEDVNCSLSIRNRDKFTQNLNTFRHNLNGSNKLNIDYHSNSNSIEMIA